MIQTEKKKQFTRYLKVIKIGEKAVKFHRSTSYIPAKENIEKRGEINSFSRHSALRLRQALSFSKLNTASYDYGITLTVPWDDKTFDLGIFGKVDKFELYKECFHRFSIYFRRRFPSSAAIFRHELQTRKMPHAHIVVYFSSFDLVNFDKRSKLASENDIKVVVTSLWVRALNKNFCGGRVDSFFRYGVKVSKLDGSPAAIRYICDHASKHKQAQLGYKGKQWGYINKACLTSTDDVYFGFSDSQQLVKFSRSIRRLSRFSIDAPRKVFGKKLVARSKLRSIHFVSSSNAQRLAEFILGKSSLDCSDTEGYLNKQGKRLSW